MEILPEDITFTEKFDHLLPSIFRTLNYHYHLKTSRIRHVAGGEQARGEWVRAPVNFFFRPSSKGGPAKTLHTNTEILTPSFRVT
jgi:hypothetical protein